MIYTLVIPGTLPNLNDYVNAERANKYAGHKMKKDAEALILQAIKSQLKGVKITKKVNMVYTWFEPNRKRDKDNIAFAKKFIQDALVEAGVIKNDGWKEIKGFSDLFEVDKAYPRVIVDLVVVE